MKHFRSVTNANALARRLGGGPPQGVAVWGTRFGPLEDYSDYSNAICTDPSGNVFIAATFFTTTLNLSNATGATSTLSRAGASCGFVAKYSSNGERVWATKMADTVEFFSMGGAALDSSGNLFACGEFQGVLTLYNATTGTYSGVFTSKGGPDTILIKYSPTGTVLWAAQIGGLGFDMPYGLTTDSSNNVFIAGRFSSNLTLGNSSTLGGNYIDILPGTATSSGQTFLAKYSSTGSVLWAAKIGGDMLTDIPASIKTDSIGNLYLCGTYRSDTLILSNATTIGGVYSNQLTRVNANYESWVAKYSSTGTVLWVAQSSGPDNYGTSIATDSSGNAYVCGTYGGPGGGGNSFTLSNATAVGGAYQTIFPNPGTRYFGYLAKYSSTGTVLWVAQTSYPTGGSQTLYCVDVDTDNNVFLSGVYSTQPLTLSNATTIGGNYADLPITPNNSSNGFLAKYSSNGKVLWTTRMTPNYGTATARNIATYLNTNVFVAGKYSAGSGVPLNLFSAGSSVASITLPIYSTGQYDMYLAKYTT